MDLPNGVIPPFGDVLTTGGTDGTVHRWKKPMNPGHLDRLTTQIFLARKDQFQPPLSVSFCCILILIPEQFSLLVAMPLRSGYIGIFGRFPLIENPHFFRVHLVSPVDPALISSG